MPARDRLTETVGGWLAQAAARYPGWEEIPLAEARRAVASARRARGELRPHLPEAALRRRR